MEIIIRDRHKLLSTEATLRAQSKASSTFAKFGDVVGSVTVSVQDVNGPKGGVDKECRIQVDLKRLKSIVVSVKEESLSKAIPFALNRAGRAVRRVLDRRQLLESRSFARFGMNS